MISKHLCPCCSLPLLRHISSHRIYWFCSSCHQEMPILENGGTVASHLGLHDRSEYGRSVTPWGSGQKTGFGFEVVNPWGGLTQLTNRQCFEVYLDQEWRRMARDQTSLSVILCDLDVFDPDLEANAELGSEARLPQIAQAIAKAVKRPADLVAHYQDQRFAVLLPNTNAEGAMCVAEQIRSNVKALKMTSTASPANPSVTVSVGVASMIPSSEYAPEMLMTAAAQALYQAKLQGGDRLILHEQLLRQIQLVAVDKLSRM